jgi:hypothetical protein
LIATRIKRKFLEQLDAQLAELGFRRISDKFHGERYDRWADNVRHSISLGLIPREGCLEVESPFISVRFDAVEKLIAKFEDPHPLVKPSDVDVRSTVGKRLGSEIGSRSHKHWKLQQDEDAVKCAGEIVSLIRGEGLSFWAQFSVPSESLRLLLGNDSKSRSAGGPDGTRAQKAIAMALLFDNPEEARRLATSQLSQLEGPEAMQTSRWVDKLFGTADIGPQKREL